MIVIMIYAFQRVFVILLLIILLFERRRPLRKPKHRLVDNIRMTHRGIWWEVVDWMHLAQYRVQWQTR